MEEEEEVVVKMEEEEEEARGGDQLTTKKCPHRQTVKDSRRQHAEKAAAEGDAAAQSAQTPANKRSGAFDFKKMAFAYERVCAPLAACRKTRRCIWGLCNQKRAGASFY